MSCPFSLSKGEKEIELERDFQASIFSIRLQAMQSNHVEKHSPRKRNTLL
jgi:hypothetical protein